MVPFRQPIRPGDKGRDVRAVKRTMRQRDVPGVGRMTVSNFAGSEFVHCLRTVQRNGGVKVDGIYGKSTHALLAPHFDAYSRMLYRTAKLRSTTLPGTDTTAQAAAKQLLEYQKAGKYHSDNPADLPQIQAAAAGKAVWSQGGYYVHIDKRVFEVLNFLIGKGHKIGTYAICSDHAWDGPNGHAGGHAVDISSIDGLGVNSQSKVARENVLKVATLLSKNTPAELKPWQLICDGYGFMHDDAISACCIPSASFFGWSTLTQHRNHIHVGYH